MPSGTFTAGITSTANGPLTISQFYSTPRSTPGNVGVCLSGGGSRAMTAGMGQLRALSYLTSGNQSLLGQVKAISTASGGSWLGVPFAFLPANAPSDASYLGSYNSNQGALKLAELAQLPAGNAGVPLTTELFSLPGIAAQAYLLWKFLHVPANMLWQTALALHLLSDCDLYSMVSAFNLGPNDMFSFDRATVQKDVTNPGSQPPLNPSLAQETVHFFADQVSSSRTPRPFLICNISMLVNEPGAAVQFLAPVQATAFLTGILGTPQGTDDNGQPLGGGGVSSFAFNSNFVSAQNGVATVEQTRQWSLIDIMGASSAFYAQELKDQFLQWAADPKKFAADLAESLEKIWEWIQKHFPSHMHASALDHLKLLAAPHLLNAPFLKVNWPAFDAIIPAYNYWPVSSPQPLSNPQSTQFADGGSLENTAINGLLAYSDVKSVISFINTEQPLVAGKYGISDGQGGTLPDTNYIVDEMIPPLFGYRPYESGEIDESYTGYVLYATTNYSDYEMYKNNQIFDSRYFPALLQGLAAAAGAGLISNSPIFTQNLEVLPNTTFGIKGGQSITVVWCYLNYAAAWGELFAGNSDVQKLIQSEVASHNFPHYHTPDTCMSASQINLIAGLTSWSVVAADEPNKTFTSLFTASAAAAKVG
jgi:hypothetical protein